MSRMISGLVFFRNYLIVVIEKKGQGNLRLNEKSFAKSDKIDSQIVKDVVGNNQLITLTVALKDGEYKLLSSNLTMIYMCMTAGVTRGDAHFSLSGMRMTQFDNCVITETEPEDNIDNDCDGAADEELLNDIDDDRDELIDEDLSAVNGVWGRWTPWSECTCQTTTATFTRTRKCNSPPPSEGGLQCGYSDLSDTGEPIDPKSLVGVEAVPCIKTPPCPSNDGNWGEWGHWGGCSPLCGSASFKQRERRCDNPAPKQGGASCKGSSTSSSTCDSLPPCAGHTLEEAPDTPHSEWGPWGPWGPCTSTCGTTSFKARTRACYFIEGNHCNGPENSSETCDFLPPCGTEKKHEFDRRTIVQLFLAIVLGTLGEIVIIVVFVCGFKGLCKKCRNAVGRKRTLFGSLGDVQVGAELQDLAAVGGAETPRTHTKSETGEGRLPSADDIGDDEARTSELETVGAEVVTTNAPDTVSEEEHSD